MVLVDRNKWLLLLGASLGHVAVSCSKIAQEDRLGVVIRFGFSIRHLGLVYC